MKKFTFTNFLTIVVLVVTILGSIYILNNFTKPQELAPKTITKNTNQNYNSKFSKKVNEIKDFLKDNGEEATLITLSQEGYDTKNTKVRAYIFTKESPASNYKGIVNNTGLKIDIIEMSKKNNIIEGYIYIGDLENFAQQEWVDYISFTSTNKQ
ncbi:MAG: hypothetical protein R3B92_02860 [Patescibacteria group bacterium]